MRKYKKKIGIEKEVTKVICAILNGYHFESEETDERQEEVFKSLY